MHHSNQNISNLIVRYLHGKLTKDQKNTLENWLQNPRKKALFDKIVSKEKILKKSFQYDELKQEEAWNRIKKQIGRKLNYKKYLAYVATFILPIAIGIFFLKEKNEFEQRTPQTKSIRMEKNRTVLYLSDGKIIDLEKDTSMLIRSKDKLLIENTNRKLQIKNHELKVDDFPNMNKIVTPFGGKYILVLADGTKVWLNAGSYLKFPSKFSAKERKVIAKGELYFEVKNDNNRPFVVEMDEMHVKVLGTEFNLRSYDNDPHIRSTLLKGSISVHNSMNENLVLSQGYQAIIFKKDHALSKTKVNIEEVVAWKKDQFVFDNKRLKDIMYDLARWYNIKPSFANQSLENKRFSVDVERYVEIEDILNLIEGTGDVKFVVEGNLVKVE